MQVIKIHHIDISDPDATGYELYSYEYDHYVFSADGLSYSAKSYVSDPAVALFLEKKTEKLTVPWIASDLKNYLFQMAVSYLRDEGKTEFTVLGVRIEP